MKNLPCDGDSSASPRNDREGLCAFLHLVGEIGKKDAECSNYAQAQRRVCPKVYFCTSKGAVWTEKKEDLFQKSPEAFLPYIKHRVKE